MTSEQLCVLIQQGGKELLPILWERVKRLCFMLCGFSCGGEVLQGRKRRE